MTVGSIAAFVRALQDLAPNSAAVVDEADAPEGESFVDVADGDFKTVVSYRPGTGFGIYVSPGEYGQKPDESFRNAAKAAQRVVQLRDAFRKGVAARHLSLLEMRLLTGLTQVEVARALDIKQPSVQRIEQRSNVQIETLLRHIHAMGGRLELTVIFDDMEARLELPPTKASGC